MRDKILDIARGEIGTREFPPGSNNVKYNTAYYGGEVSGRKYPWCCVFIWWLFREAGAPKLFFNGKKTAYCPALFDYHRRQGQAFGVAGHYEPGDIIFFNFNGGSSPQHVGICESWDGRYITTIDGNTGTGSEADGGAVMRRKRASHYIVGAYRPKYEVCDMKESEIRYIVKDEIRKYMDELSGKRPNQSWQADGIRAAMSAGISDGSNPLALCTRVEAMIMATNAAKSKG